MNYQIRPAGAGDEPFLWNMLYYAANMSEDGAVSSDSARTHPYLAKYVHGWGRAGDLGAIARDPAYERSIGAAWLRILADDEKNYPSVAPGIPELAIAVLPEYTGREVGSQLLLWLLEAAKPIYPAIVLSVREANPARRLYQRMGFMTVDTVVNRVGGVSYVMQVDLLK